MQSSSSRPKGRRDWRSFGCEIDSACTHKFGPVGLLSVVESFLGRRAAFVQEERGSGTKFKLSRGWRPAVSPSFVSVLIAKSTLVSSAFGFGLLKRGKEDKKGWVCCEFGGVDFDLIFPFSHIFFPCQFGLL